mmetsp:Transcript_37408/g.105586  ORF Transcript_37408/g.105586 Transcript_37408/m.105586 type:complete len:408 (-) Transcript_37408:364-1587(-)
MAAGTDTVRQQVAYDDEERPPTRSPGPTGEQALVLAEIHQQLKAVKAERDAALEQLDLVRQQLAETSRAGTGDGGEQQEEVQRDSWERLRRLGADAGWLVEARTVEVTEVDVASGAFGVTHRALWRGGEVAVKQVRVSTPEEAMCFLREVEAMSSVRHPCVLPFIGAVLSPPDATWILADWMPGGDLATWLHGDRTKGIPKLQRPLSHRLQKALEVAAGMQALQELRPPIMHRDLKPSNVLLDGAGVARVGDMGLAKRCTEEMRGSATGETGTYLYMAPEVMRHEPYDSKVDVFSWAVLAAEMVSGETPYHEWAMEPEQIALAVAHHNLRPTLPHDLLPGVASLLRLAWDPNPVKRPFFRDITRDLRRLLKREHLEGHGPGTMHSANPVGNFIRGLGFGAGRPWSAR